MAALAFQALSAAVTLLAAAACGLAAWRKRGRERVAWALIALSCLAWWILLEAARQVRRWQDELHVATLGLAVNLSVRQLNDDGLADDISQVLHEIGLQPSLLMLEMRRAR